MKLMGMNGIWTLAIAATAVFALHSLTVNEYPPAWFDEVEIIEMGRFSIFDIRPKWSVNLFTDANGTLQTPLPMLHYLAGTMQEFLYRATGSFLCGRFAMLLSLPVCALAMFGWLRTKGFRVSVVFLTSLLFLFDPNATICAHWYRPDLWCMALAFTALTVMAKTVGTSRQMPGFIAAGVMAAVSMFFWITSVLFMPLILVEAWQHKEKKTPRLLCLTIGGTVAVVLLMVPLYRYLPDIANQFLAHSEVGSMGRQTSLSRYAIHAFDFIKIAIRSPFSWLLAAIGLCPLQRFKIHAAIFAGLCLFMVATRVYHLRMVYLMPYIFLFAATALDRLLGAGRESLQWCGRTLVASALVSGFGISVIALNFAAWPERNTLHEFTQRLQAALPAESPRVYLMDMEHELYYAGRKLGWKMFSTMPRAKVLDGRHADFLTTLDAVVITEMCPKLSDAEQTILRSSGFSQSAAFTMPPAATGRLKSKLANFIYAHGYPACEIWTRTNDEAP